MTLDRVGDALWFAGAFLLLGSALVTRQRRQAHRMAPMVLSWIAIFALLFAIAHWLDHQRQGPQPRADIYINLT